MKARLLIMLLLGLHTSMVWAVACDQIFTNGVQSHNPSGQVDLGYQVAISGGSDVLSTVTLNMQSPPGQATCGGSPCTASGSPAASSSPAFVFGNGSDGAVNVTGGGNNNLGAGDYTSVSVNGSRRLTFNDANSTYLMESLTTGYQSELRFRAGDYWIDGNMTIGQETELRRQGGGGAVRIFVNGDVQLNYQAFTSGFAPGELLIYATGNITLGQEVDVSGFLYAGGTMQVGYQTEVNGAVSGSSAQVDQWAEINYDGGALVAPDFAPFCDPEADDPALLVSHWTMDEFLWDGTSGEVVDSSGNGNNATASSAVTDGASPAIPGDPGTCRYGVFDGVDDYLAAPNVSATLNATASLAFWINTTQTGSNTAWQAPGVTGVEQSGGADDIFWGWLDASGRIGVAVGNNNSTKSNSSINSGSWRHVVLTRDHQAGTYQVFIDGALDASGGIATGVIGTGYGSIGRVENTGATAPVHLEAMLDEVHIFEGVLTASEVSALMMKTRPCLAVDHYTISHSGNGITCEAEPITITARDSDGNAIAPPAGAQVELRTVPDTGDWGSGNNIYTYTFTGSETQFTAYLQQTTPATLNIDVTDGSASEITSADPDIIFTDTGLRFYDDSTALGLLPNQVAGTLDPNPVLRIVRTDNETGACVARVQNRALDVNLAFECRNPVSCVGGQTLNLNGTAVAPNNNGAAITYTAVNVNFDNAGFASIPLVYSDVGQMRLHGQINLPAEGNDPAVSIAGSSNEFVVKPHTLEVSAVEDSSGAANPATTSAGNGFVPAGTSFVVRVEAHNSQGNVTPNYGNETTSQVPRLAFGSLVYPSGGVNGNLSGTNSFSAQGNGVAENTSVAWDEVGSITLVPHLTGDNYLGAGDLVTFTPSGTIGRFYPFDYAMASSATADSCVTFTYMGEPAIEVDYTLQARNIGGVTVQNYDEALGYSGTATVDYVAENADDGTDLDRETIATGQWAAGQLIVNDTEALFARDTAPEAPLADLQLGLALTDALDSRSLIDLDMNPTTTGDCTVPDNCTAKALGTSLELRYGRLFLASAYGPEVLNLPVRFTTEFYNDGLRWQRNNLDTCTTIPRDTVQYPAGTIDNDANLTVTLGGGSTTGEYGSLSPTEISFTSGQVNHFFTAPGEGNRGNFEVRINLTDKPWLQFDWDNGAAPNEVLGIYEFGSYRGHDRIIYWREVF